MVGEERRQVSVQVCLNLEANPLNNHVSEQNVELLTVVSDVSITWE